MTAGKFQEPEKAVPGVHLPPDGGWGWMVVLGSLLGTMCLSGFMNSFGVLFPFLLEEFGESRGATSMILSAQIFSVTAMNLVAGGLVAKFDHRPVAFASAILSASFVSLASFSPSLPLMVLLFAWSGMSFSLGFMSLITMPAKYFTKRRGLAVGLSGTGQGFGQAICNPLLQFLCNALGWRMALKVMAVKMFFLVAFGAYTMRPATWVRPPALPEGKRSPALLDCSFFRDPAFSTVYLVFVFCGLGFFTPIAHLVRYAMDQGLSEQQAASLMVVIGGCNVVGRVLGGKLSDSFGTVRTFAFCMCMTGLSTTLLPFSSAYPMMLTYALCYGLFGGSFMALNVVIYAEFFGLANLPKVMGLGTTSWLWGASIGPPMAGVIFDQTGSYTGAWLICGASLLLGGTIAACLPKVDRMYPDRCKRPEPEDPGKALVVEKEAGQAGPPRGSMITSLPTVVSPPGSKALAQEEKEEENTLREASAGVKAGGLAPPAEEGAATEEDSVGDTLTEKALLAAAASPAGEDSERTPGDAGGAPFKVILPSGADGVLTPKGEESGKRAGSGSPALALGVELAALEARFQASEEEKSQLQAQLTRLQAQLQTSEEERRVLSERTVRSVEDRLALSEERNRALAIQLTTVPEEVEVDLESGQLPPQLALMAADAATSRRSASQAACCSFGV